MMDHSEADKIYAEIEALDQLEDRREYDKEMLAQMYGTDEYTTERLYDLIQSDFGTTEPISGAWDGILKHLRIKEEAGYNLSDEGYARLGRYIYDYLTSAVCDMNWEGFNDVQLHGIKVLLRDMAIGAEAESKHDTYGKDIV